MHLKNFKKIIGIISGIIFFSFLVFIVILIFEGQTIRKDIRDYGKPSIGQFVSHERYKKGYKNHFIYYINDVKYKGIASWKGSEDLDQNVGKFYRIRYSEKFKGFLNANFNEEITDSTEILKAGFTLKGILGNDTVRPKERSFKNEIFTILGFKPEN